MSNGCPASPSSQLWARTVSDTARSNQPWIGLHHLQAKTPEKKHNKKSLIICTVTNDVEIQLAQFLHMPALLYPIGVNVINPTATLWKLL